MKVCEHILSTSVIILFETMYFELADALGRYVIEQKNKQSNHTKTVNSERSKNQKMQQNLNSRSSDSVTGYDGFTSVSGHRVPVSGPRQLQKQQFDSTSVRIETILVMSILGGALVCLIVIQVWRQISAYKKRRLRNNNTQIIESIKQQTGTQSWNRDQIQIVSAEFVDANGAPCSSDLQDCDCEMKPGHRHQRGYEKVACLTTSITEDSPTDDALIDSLMMQQNLSSHHRPEIVHVNMNIVQVVHHCGEPDPSRCKQDGCGVTTKNRNSKNFEQNQSNTCNKHLSPSVIPVQYQDGYQNTIIDMEESKKVDNVWDDNICSKKIDSSRLSPSNISRKSGKSLISNVESSDSERYDTVVNLQDMKHSDTAALLVKDGKRK